MPRRRRSSTTDDGLVCPTCGRAYPSGTEERFCGDCGMPLVLAGEDARADVRPSSEARERALKIKPEYSRGPLVRVAGGRNQAEAELIQNLLLDHGIPSMFKRSAAADVPELLAAGERDVFVPQTGAEAARDLLVAGGLMPSASAAPLARPNAAKLLVGFLAAAALTALICWALLELTG